MVVEGSVLFGGVFSEAGSFMVSTGVISGVSGGRVIGRLMRESFCGGVEFTGTFSTMHSGVRGLAGIRFMGIAMGEVRSAVFGLSFRGVTSLGRLTGSCFVIGNIGTTVTTFVYGTVRPGVSVGCLFVERDCVRSVSKVVKTTALPLVPGVVAVPSRRALRALRSRCCYGRRRTVGVSVPASCMIGAARSTKCGLLPSSIRRTVVMS